MYREWWERDSEILIICFEQPPLVPPIKAHEHDIADGQAAKMRYGVRPGPPATLFPLGQGTNVDFMRTTNKRAFRSLPILAVAFRITRLASSASGWRPSHSAGRDRHASTVGGRAVA